MTAPDGRTPYREAAFYVMSGTGNSYRAARWAAEQASEVGLSAEVRALDEPLSSSDAHGPTRLIGLFMPTHGFTAPWLAIKWAARMPRSAGTHAFCVATRASIRLGPWATPGLSGTATLLIALIFALKGCSIRGMLGLDMPSNWLQVHPGFKPANVAFVLDKVRPRTIRFMGAILEGRRASPVIGTLYDVVSGVPMIPISILYLLYGRLFFAKMFYATDKCNGCRICETSCPTGGVKVIGTRKPRPYWNYHCESCNRCISYCPRKAIEVGHSWFLVLTAVSVIPFLPWLWPGAPLWTRWFELLGSPVLGWIAVWVFWYALLLVGYPLFYAALLWRPLNWLATATSVTRFWRRHREPGTKLRDLVPKPKQAAWKKLGRKGKEGQDAA